MVVIFKKWTTAMSEIVIDHVQWFGGVGQSPNKNTSKHTNLLHLHGFLFSSFVFLFQSCLLPLFSSKIIVMKKIQIKTI